MLDPKVIEVVKRMVLVQFDERREQLKRDVEMAQAKASTRGMASSGPVIVEVYGLCAHDIEVRTQIVWQTLRKVLLETGIVPSEVLAEDLKEFVTSHTAAIIAVPSEHYERVVRNTGINRQHPSIDTALQRAIDKVNADIDFLALSLMRRQEAEANHPGSQQPIFNIGSVGAIQTAPSATANITMNIGPEDREALLCALALVKEGLAGVESLPAHPTPEIIELVDEVKSEIEKPKPNGTRLGSLALTIATAIQTAGSLQPAYQTLKAALLPFGILLP